MKGNVMKEKKSKLHYETPELTVTKVKMETEFLAAVSMYHAAAPRAEIEPFTTDATAPGANEDIQLNLE
jgi:hypothetical protein